MERKSYRSPILMDVSDGGTGSIGFGGSAGTSGGPDDSRYEWDPRIDPDDIDMFWLSYDETDLEMDIDQDQDMYITYDEFYNWLDSIGGF